MLFQAARHTVFNRGSATQKFLEELVAWARISPNKTFEVNDRYDIYSKVKEELGPYLDLNHRKAIMLEVLRVLALFESGCDWTEGVDTSRLGTDTPNNAEAGAWQVSFDSHRASPDLIELCQAHLIDDGVKFQQVTKFDHGFAMQYIAYLLRVTANQNGPLYKGQERIAIRKSLRGPENSIYPYLSRGAVKEFEVALLE